jgi:hypothetical protein
LKSTRTELIMIENPRTLKIVQADDTIIALRDRLAAGLDYVKRPCSLGPNARTGEHRECWERPALDCEHRGRKVSSFHCVTELLHPKGSVLHWPEDVEKAAWAIDGGKRDRSG